MSSENQFAPRSDASVATDTAASPPAIPLPASPLPDRAILWLRRGDRIFIGILTGAALLLMSIHWIRLSDWGARPIDIDHLPQAEYQYEIDVNRATWVEWAQFDGIGETLARRIVADRELNGDFESINDLLRVRGVGKKKLADMRRHLHVRHAANPFPETDATEQTAPDARIENPGEGNDVDGEINEVP